MNVSVPQNRLGLLIVVSGPSGSGKTTLCRKACEAGEAIFSVSCTTRAPRPGEVDGKDYFFLSEEQFQEKVRDGELFEYATVHGRSYGTLKSFVFENLRRGVDVLLDIDVQGAEQVRACRDELLKKCLVDIFILPPSEEELRARLSGRGTESADTFELRMKNAVAEMQHWRKYQFTLISGSMEDDAARFRSILVAERMRTDLLK
jgi:guanylate kinase